METNCTWEKWFIRLSIASTSGDAMSVSAMDTIRRSVQLPALQSVVTAPVMNISLRTALLRMVQPENFLVITVNRRSWSSKVIPLFGTTAQPTKRNRRSWSAP